MEKVCWNITSKCNRNCKYCFRFNRSDLPLENNLSILDKLICYGVTKIVWAGGEPFLYKDLNKLLKISHEHNILNYVNTNATNLSIDNIKDKLLYVDKIIISLDFVNDELNKTNGIGNHYYKHVREVVKEIKRVNKNIKIQINTVLFKNNVNLIDELYNELLSMNIDYLKLIRFFPVRGVAQSNKDDLSISDLEFNNIYKKYSKSKQAFKIIIHGTKEMNNKHFIILSSGELICSENGKDIIIDDKLY